MKKTLIMIAVFIFLAGQVAFAATPKKVSTAVYQQKKAVTIVHTATLTRHIPAAHVTVAARPAPAARPMTPKPAFKPTHMVIQAPKPALKPTHMVIQAPKPTTKTNVAAVRPAVNAGAAVKNKVNASLRIRQDANTKEINKFKQEATKNYIESIKNSHAAIPEVYLKQPPIK